MQNDNDLAQDFLPEDKMDSPISDGMDQEEVDDYIEEEDEFLKDFELPDEEDAKDGDEELGIEEEIEQE